MTSHTTEPALSSVNQRNAPRIFPSLVPVSLLSDRRLFPIPLQTESELKESTITHPKSSKKEDAKEFEKKERKAAKIKERKEKINRHHQRKALLQTTDVIQYATCALLALPLVLVATPVVAMGELVRIYFRYRGKVDERYYDSDYDDSDDDSDDETDF